MSLPLQTQCFGHILYPYATLPSTNTLALQLLAKGTPEGTVVLAHQQSAGRGQHGHQWNSTVGGIYLSVVLYPQLAIEKLLQITLWSAWGVCWSLRRQGLPVHLKWPNDLLCEGKKIGGILVETKLQGSQLQGVVIGVGINGCNQIPETATNLSRYQKEFDYDTSTARILLGLEVGYRLWQRWSFSQLQRHYYRWWLNYGQDTPLGRVLGIDEWGRLCLDGGQRYYPGEIQLAYPQDKNSEVS